MTALGRNSLLNVVGQGLPILIGFFALPWMVAGFGNERVGLLTLGWAIVGYFSLFDLGLGRALTHIVSRGARRDTSEGGQGGQGEAEELAAHVWGALRLMLVFGLVGAGIGAVLTPMLVNRVLSISPELRGEALTAFFLLASCIPVVVLTSGLRGILEAYHRFDLVNAIRAPMGVLTYGGPLLLLPFTRSLTGVVVLLVLTRLGALAAHVALCLRVMPSLRRPAPRTTVDLRHLAKMGGWMTISNVVSPIMVTFDRFLIAALSSAAVVAFYTVPFEAVSKVLIVPWSIAFALFPAFSASEGRKESAALFARGVGLTTLLVFPIAATGVLFAPEILRLWVGAEFAASSTRIIQILLLGIFINSLVQTPFVLIQGVGRSDITAKLHLLEVPLYLAGAWFLISRYGAIGAAVAWLLRVALDTTLQFVVAGRLEPDPDRPRIRRLRALTGTAVLLLAAALAMASSKLPARLAIAGAEMAVFLSVAWMASEARIIRGGLFGSAPSARRMSAVDETPVSDRATYATE